jgi:hypothetical protein
MENKVMFLGYPSAAAPMSDMDIEILGTGTKLLLSARGFVVDTIDTFSNILDFKEFTASDTAEEELKKATPYLPDHLWETVCGSPHQMTSRDLHNLIITLSPGWVDGNHITQNHQLFRSDFAAYLQQFQRILQSHSLKIIQSLSVSMQTELHRQAMGGSVTRFVQAMQSCNSRRVFRTGGGSYGLGPRIMRPGDVCCILIGSQFPMVMRKQGKNWELVGECVIHGFMNLEVLNLYKKGELELQRFKIA